MPTKKKAAPKRTTPNKAAKKVMSSYEDLQGHIPKLPTPAVEVFANMYSKREYEIEMEIPEFTAICPKTGLPDFGAITITYVPDKVCLELKSLKEYMVSYRNLGIFHENVVNKVLDDLVKACKPRKMTVYGEYNVRGGIYTSVTAEYVKKR
jgi:7-cyano-7-deazaguanine reductase